MHFQRQILQALDNFQQLPVLLYRPYHVCSIARINTRLYVELTNIYNYNITNNC